ncbi:hypothetical protein BHE90_016785 [Fusarium euwallaceae]|uniref:Uncharacterized protein n=2 Tax=Fusarium solani species complex TaxID=232080 RepID=A0A430KZG0_9HYPO|nr:hypothetical protein CEP51_015635 [Fusarium floridanum]RTE68837.1 hypothetical protein BHE90_016785 [Fusarium euwallaceae]
MSHLPDTLSEVSTNKTWEAYNNTKGSWEDFCDFFFSLCVYLQLTFVAKSRQQQQQQQQGYPEPQTPSPTLQRRTVPPSLFMRSRPTSFPPELPLSGPPLVTRRAQHPSPIDPPDMTGLLINPVDRRPLESTPPPVWRRRHLPSTQSPSPGYPPPGPDPGPSRSMTQKRAWLLQQHEASRQRFTAALHAAVDAEGDMAKYKAQLQKLGGGFHDDDDEDEEEEDEELEGQSPETAQKPVAPKSNAKMRRERKKRLGEGRMAKEN